MYINISWLILFVFFVEHKYIHLDSWGKLVPLQIEILDTIRSVKENIQHKIEVPFEQQEVIFKGRILQDDSVLSEFNDIEYSKFEVSLKVIGKNEELSLH